MYVFLEKIALIGTLTLIKFIKIIFIQKPAV